MLASGAIVVPWRCHQDLTRHKIQRPTIRVPIIPILVIQPPPPQLRSREKTRGIRLTPVIPVHHRRAPRPQPKGKTTATVAIREPVPVAVNPLPPPTPNRLLLLAPAARQQHRQTVGPVEPQPPLIVPAPHNRRRNPPPVPRRRRSLLSDQRLPQPRLLQSLDLPLDRHRRPSPPAQRHRQQRARHRRDLPPRQHDRRLPSPLPPWLQLNRARSRRLGLSVPHANS